MLNGHVREFGGARHSVSLEKLRRELTSCSSEIRKIEHVIRHFATQVLSHLSESKRRAFLRFRVGDQGVDAWQKLALSGSEEGDGGTEELELFSTYHGVPHSQYQSAGGGILLDIPTLVRLQALGWVVRCGVGWVWGCEGGGWMGEGHGWEKREFFLFH